MDMLMCHNTSSHLPISLFTITLLNKKISIYEWFQSKEWRIEKRQNARLLAGVLTWRNSSVSLNRRTPFRKLCSQAKVKTIPPIPLVRLTATTEKCGKIWSGCRLPTVIPYNGSNLHSVALISALPSAPAIRHSPCESMFLYRVFSNQTREGNDKEQWDIQKVMKEDNWRGWMRVLRFHGDNLVLAFQSASLHQEAF